MFSNLGNNPKKTCSKDGIEAFALMYMCIHEWERMQMYVRHPSSSQWTLTTSRKCIWASNLNILIFMCTYVFNEALNPYHHPNLERKKSLGALIWLLQLCNNWIFSNFVGLIFIHFLFPCLRLEVGFYMQVIDASILRVIWKFQVHWNPP
jgi:hypothetical protein